MKLNTKNFGEIEYNEDLIIEFADGLPGFPDRKRFITIANDEDDLFYWLQAVDDEEVAFVLINVYQVMPDYNPLVDKEELTDIGDLEGVELMIYNIVVIPEDIKQMRVNLKAPVVINPVSKKGRQVILNNDEYSVRHYIFDEIKKISR